MYDDIFSEIDTQLDWLVQTGDKTAVPQIRKLLKGLRARLDAPSAAEEPQPVARKKAKADAETA
jgi:hypothetical protein